MALLQGARPAFSLQLPKRTHLLCRHVVAARLVLRWAFVGANAAGTPFGDKGVGRVDIHAQLCKKGETESDANRTF